jgi:hypothetical protein
MNEMQTTVHKSPVLSGLARNAKAGAVLVEANGNVSYVVGLHEWHGMADGMQVLLLGARGEAQHVPTATVSADGAWTAGKTDSGPDPVIYSLYMWLPAPPWKISYADGSNNCTTISAEAAATPEAPTIAWKYDPMTPAMSSSGNYSGGEPAEGLITVDDAAFLWNELLAVLDATDSHTDERAKFTGLLRLTTAAGTRRVIVQTSPKLRMFEMKLKSLRQPLAAAQPTREADGTCAIL